MGITGLAFAFVRMACHMRLVGIGSVVRRQFMLAVVVRFFGSMVMVVTMFMTVVMSMIVSMVMSVVMFVIMYVLVLMVVLVIV